LKSFVAKHKGDASTSCGRLAGQITPSEIEDGGLRI